MKTLLRFVQRPATLLFLALLLLALSGMVAYKTVPQIRRHVQLLLLKPYAYYLFPSMAQNNEEFLKEIDTIRGYVYQNTLGAPTSFDISNPLVEVHNLTTHRYRGRCGSFALLYQHLLYAKGYKARLVQLATQSFMDGNALEDTHITVEVYNPFTSEWLVSCPMFDIRITCSQTGKGSVKDLHACLQAKGQLVYHEGSSLKKPQRSISTYGTPYEQLLFATMTLDTLGDKTTTDAFVTPFNNWLNTALEKYKK